MLRFWDGSCTHPVPVFWLGESNGTTCGDVINSGGEDTSQPPNKYLQQPLLKSCGDAAMNDKTLKCITMMSHEIKPIYRGALCEKYGNNIALVSKTAPCIWNMWSGVRNFSGVFTRPLTVNTNGVRWASGAI